MEQAISFDCTDAELSTVTACINRGVHLKLIKKGQRAHHRMNLLAAHANGNPLDFDRLLAFDDFNFTHDLLGIDRHLDRDTGHLTGMFQPRSSRRAA